MSLRGDIRGAVIGAMIVALMLVPVYGALSGDSFSISLGTRILILALAATSLNLILGYGGMVSFGHAAYLGIGGYAVGILAEAGIVSGWVQWSVAVTVSALVALVIGALCLRTRGVNFIMITLAFAQMIYYVASGLDQYGGDDGLIISTRSQFSLINLTDRTQFYYLCAGLLLAAILLSKRMMNARFGWVIRGARSNERRMRALGFPIFGYRLLCFVIAGGVCGLAGALLANHSDFVSPAVMSWTRSGDLIVMVAFGGIESAFGPLIGAIVYLLGEEALSRVTEYWQLILGPLLLVVAVVARGGLYGLLAGLGRG
jgi:branched-chain amino acid transport system permease protein